MKLKKRLGQNFLKCERILSFISSKTKECKEVLEIGGGDGRLTKKLSKNSFVYVVEIDRRFHKNLDSIENVKLIPKDFLKLKPFKVNCIVGNVPYYISSKILFKLLEWGFEKAVLMFQKEFVDKMLAKENESNYGRLSVTSKYYFDIKKLKQVPAKCFVPKPKVDSAIIEIKKIREKNEKFDALVRRIFSLKNKKLRNVVENCPEEFEQRRARELSIEEIEKLSRIIK